MRIGGVKASDGAANQVVSGQPQVAAGGGNLPPLLLLFLDPVSLNLADPNGNHVSYNLQTNAVSDQNSNAFVSVAGNVEVLVMPVVSGSYNLDIADAPSAARGGLAIVGGQSDQTMALTVDPNDPGLPKKRKKQQPPDDQQKDPLPEQRRPASRPANEVGPTTRGIAEVDQPPQAPPADRPMHPLPAAPTPAATFAVTPVVAVVPSAQAVATVRRQLPRGRRRRRCRVRSRSSKAASGRAYSAWSSAWRCPVTVG